MRRSLNIVLCICIPVITLFLCGTCYYIAFSIQELGDAGVTTMGQLKDALATSNETIIDLDDTVKQLQSELKTSDNTISSVQNTLVKANSSIDSINRSCVPGPCGTLADINKTLNTVRGTFGQIEIAANHEDKNLSRLDQQELILFGDFHQLASQGINTTTNIDSLLKDKAISETFTHIDNITANGDRISADVAFETNKLAHPPIKKLTAWGALEGAGDFARHFMPAIF